MKIPLFGAGTIDYSTTIQDAASPILFHRFLAVCGPAGAGALATGRISTLPIRDYADQPKWLLCLHILDLSNASDVPHMTAYP